MTKKQALFFLILILLLTTALAGLTYFLAKKRVQPQPEKISPANTNTSVQDLETPELDTSNWLTYRNEEYGFEFKYPEGWCVDIYDCNNLKEKQKIYLGFIESSIFKFPPETAMGPGLNTSNKVFKKFDYYINGLTIYYNYYHLDFPQGSFSKYIIFYPKLSKSVTIDTDFFINEHLFIWPEDQELIAQTIKDLEEKTIYPKEIKTFDQIISTLKKIE